MARLGDWVREAHGELPGAGRHRRGAVHRDVRHDPAAHQLDEHRREPSLHDVAAEHDYDTAFASRGGGDRADDRAEVARDKDVGESAEESAERSVAGGRVREVARTHLVRTDRDRDGADGREISLTGLAVGVAETRVVGARGSSRYGCLLVAPA